MIGGTQFLNLMNIVVDLCSYYKNFFRGESPVSARQTGYPKEPDGNSGQIHSGYL
jgi:hypothetical protein